jgi:hypothetical protein
MHQLGPTLISALAAYGDVHWTTATGFATPGAAMTLTVAYDAAKTAAPAGTALSNAVWTDAKAAFLDAKVSEAGGGTVAPNLLLSAEVATVTSQTVFTLATGSDEDDCYNDQTIILYDDSNSDYPSVRRILDYVGSTRTVTIDAAPDFVFGADDSVKVLAAAPTLPAIWSAASRTLTQTAAQVAAEMTGATLTVQRGDTLSVSFTGLGNITARTKLLVTGKKDRSHQDTASVFKIEETAGLQVIAGVTAETPANGSIVVTDATTGALTVALAAVETAKLEEMIGGHYDIQMATASGVQTLTDATLVVWQDVTRATS